jgi:hypothetical protein
LCHPGQLTAEYAAGQRARSIAPWRLTFNVVALFLALSFVTDFHVASFTRYDPSGSLAASIAEAARHAGLSESTFTERADRRLNFFYTVLVPVVVTITAAVLALTHRKRRFGTHMVFALHLTAWGNIIDALYQLSLRWLGVGSAITTSDISAQRGGIALLLLFEAATLAYVTLALRRVYGDGVVGGGLKALLVIIVRLVCGNALVFVATWLAVFSI